jgi:hypothetical protein
VRQQLMDEGIIARQRNLVALKRQHQSIQPRAEIGHWSLRSSIREVIGSSAPFPAL